MTTVNSGFPFDQIRSCTSCDLRKSCSGPVAGIGPVPAKVMLLGEAPGLEEDKTGEPFVGRAGRLLKSLLSGIGWSRELCYITNCLLCRPANNAKPTPAQIKACSHWLDIEMGVVQPDILVLMGATAIYRILGPSAGTVEHLHGKPILQDTGRKQVILLPSYHPAAALYETAQLRHVYDDFHVLQGLIAGNDPSQYIANDEHPDPNYVEIAGTDHLTWLYEVMQAAGVAGSPIAADVETVDNKLWSIQVCITPGTAYFVGPELVDQFRFPPNAQVVFHNYLYDYQFIRVENFLDTMVMAYQLGLPQGLKELASRVCGMEMQSYDDLVSGAGRGNAIQYLTKAAQMEWPPPAPVVEFKWDNKKGKLIDKVRNPQPIARKIKRILANCIDKPEVDPYKRWRSIDEQERLVVELKIGPMPVSSISDISREKAIYYACLSGESKVLMADGRYKQIRHLVRDKSTDSVMCWDSGIHQFVSRKIVNWYRNIHNDEINWLAVRTEASRMVGGFAHNGGYGTRYTPNHKLLTKRGWVAVSDLVPRDDELALPIPKLTTIQRQVLIGSNLGDGHLSRPGRSGWATLQVCHNHKQEEYIKWKHKLLGSLCQSPVKVTTRSKMVWGERRNVVDARFWTTYHPEIEMVRKASYVPNKQINHWIDDLDGLALAVWYMDDGSLHERKRPRLATNSFNLESIDYARKLLYDRWGINSSRVLVSEQHNQYITCILAPYDNFWSIIAGFVPPCMQYKLPEKWRGQYTEPVSGDIAEPFYSKVVAVTPYPIRKGGCNIRTSYCLDVAGVHNFLTLGEIAHNCRDSDSTLRVYHALLPRIHEYGLEFILNVDLSVLPVVQEMMDTGMALDTNYLKGLSTEYAGRMVTAADDLAKKAGHAFNPGSSPQVAAVVDKELGFTPTKFTDRQQVSTDDRELKKIDHPIVKGILGYRRIAKNKDAFADALVERAVLHEDHYRIHTTLKTTRTETGRLSSSGPNLQAIPTHHQEGKRIRRAFIAK